MEFTSTSLTKAFSNDWKFDENYKEKQLQSAYITFF